MDFYIGSTRVLIADDYCRDKTDEEIENILDRIAEIALDSFQKGSEADVLCVLSKEVPQ